MKVLQAMYTNQMMHTQDQLYREYANSKIPHLQLWITPWQMTKGTIKTLSRLQHIS